MSSVPKSPVVVSMPTKSPGVAILLTILFGPIGMFYSTILGALIMTPVTALIALVTLGLGLVIMWPICIIWAALAASAHNKKLLSGSVG